MRERVRVRARVKVKGRVRPHEGSLRLGVGFDHMRAHCAAVALDDDLALQADKASAAALQPRRAAAAARQVGKLHVAILQEVWLRALDWLVGERHVEWQRHACAGSRPVVGHPCAWLPAYVQRDSAREAVEAERRCALQEARQDGETHVLRPDVAKFESPRRRVRDPVGVEQLRR